MNREEALLHLRSRRPGGQEDADPEVRAALAVVSGEASTLAELEREREFDRRVAEALAGLEPPAGLRDRILERLEKIPEAAARAEKAAAPATTQRAFWRGVMTTALAAAAASALGLFFLNQGRTGKDPAGRGDIPAVVAYLDEAYESMGDFEFEDPQFGHVQAYLAKAGKPAPEELPEVLADLETLGCRFLTFRGETIGMICFQADGSVYHLFTAEPRDLKAFLPEVPPEAMPAVWETEKNAYRVWTDKGHVHIFAMSGTARELNDFF